MEEVKIVEENFKNIDPKVLLDPNRYREVLDMVLSVDAAETCDYSKEYAVLLADKLSQIANQLDANLAEKYFRLLKVLRLGSLLSVNDTEKEKFFKELILDTFTFDFVDVKNKVDFVFRGYFASREIIENLRTMFLRGLEKNIETLGNGQILVTVYGENRPVQPTIQNLLLDYNSSAHIDPVTHKRGGFDEVSFMTHSPNANKLNKQDRETLLKVIQFYDWLKFDPLIYDFRLEGQPQWQDRFFETSAPQKLIPDDLAEVIESIRGKENSQQPKYIQAEKFELPRGGLGAERDVRLPAVPRPGDGKDVGMSEVGGRRSDGLEDGRADVISSEKITSPLLRQGFGGQASPSLERRGMGTGDLNITPRPPLIIRGGDNEKTASGEAIGSLTLGNKTGAGGSLAGAKPLTSTTLQKQSYQEDINTASGNRINFQDILKDREQGMGNRQQGDAAGLRMGDGRSEIGNRKSDFITSPDPSSARRGMGTGNTGNKPSAFILNPLLEKKLVVPQSGQSGQAEIDRKLEELQKRIKN